jgi:hypothetical protein
MLPKALVKLTLSAMVSPEDLDQVLNSVGPGWFAEVSDPLPVLPVRED